MKVEVYNNLMALQASRRAVLRGAAGVSAIAIGAATGVPFSGKAFAQDNLRAEILKIPGVGKGSPTDADWQKVGEMCLGGDQGERRRGRVRRRRAHLHGAQQPEPAQLPVPRLPQAVGGLYRRQDQLDRPRPGRLQCPPAAVDRDRHRRLRHHRDGRALRGRHRRQGPARRDARLGQDRRSTWTTTSTTSRPPVGTWDGKTYRITIDGDCHTFSYRKDYFADAAITAATGMTEAPTTWEQVNDVHQEGEGPERSAHRPPRLRLPRPAEGLGRLRLLLPRGPRHGLRQASGRSGLAVRSGHHEAAGQQPGLGAGDPGRAWT